MPAGTFPFRRPGLAVGVAVAGGGWFGLDCQATPALIGAAIAIAAFAVAAAWWRRGPQRLLFLAAFAAAGFGAGLAADKGRLTPPLDAAIRSGAPTRFTGVVAEPLSRRAAPPRWMSTKPQPRLTIMIDLDAVEIGGGWQATRSRVLLSAEDTPLEAGVGDAVEGSARFVAPEGPSNPGEPDLRPRLRREGISCLGALERGALAVTHTSTGLAHRAERFREAFTAFVRGQLGENDRSALVAALAVGERSGVSLDLADKFNTSGLAHVLSISGLHLAVAVLVLAWALRRLFALPRGISNRIAPRRLAAIVALPLTLGYVILIGAPAPAVRAGLGLGLILLGTALGRDADVMNTLGWSLAAVVLFDPATLDDASTQLTFLGVTGLVLFTGPLRARIPIARPDPLATGWKRRLGRAREAVLLLGLGSIAATLATAPVTAIHFERASLVAALSNVAAWPASIFIVPAGALAAALFPLSTTLAGLLVHVAGWCAVVLAGCARFFAAWPLAALRVAPPGPLAIAGYALVVTSLLLLLPGRRRMGLAGVLTGALLLIAAAWPPRTPPGEMEITFLSVGQGDSTFVRFPQGHTMILDAGGEVSQRFDPGERIVTPFLRAKGIRRIDLLVASHPHPDHIGGMPALIERFEIGEFWHNGDGADDDGGPLGQLLATAQAAGIRTIDFREGLPVQCPRLPPLAQALPDVAALSVGDPRCTPSFPERTIDGVRIQVLHPLNGPIHAAFPELGMNDNSLVLRLTYKNVHVLLPGDVEKEGESVLLARGVDLSAEILKAPHHGSHTSSTPDFIKAVHPKYVVFCVGQNNQFHFPAPEVEERYQNAGCQRFRTDQDGAVTFTTDGEHISVKTFHPSP